MVDDELKAGRWAKFRFAVIGPLLVSPPEHGQLRAALEELSLRTFTHPLTGHPMRIGLSTLESWYYAAQRSDDPLSELRRKVRKDAGAERAVKPRLVEVLRAQYSEHPRWSYRLHYINLEARAEKDPELGPLPSYSTVRRTMKARGWRRQRRRSDHRAESGPREVRSWEKPYAHSLWHLDFHHAKRKVLLPDASWVKPKLLAVIDDHTRVCCHAQWYLDEGAEQLVHALIQAMLKRGLCRAIMMDNGSAMTAAETMQGLERLGIAQRFIEPGSPFQNGKQETFFAPVEGQLMAMLEGVQALELDLLNRATIAWVERDYNRGYHRELGCSPLQRLSEAKSVGRPAPPVQRLRDAFRMQAKRKQRRGDGTCSVEGVRFEIPAQYRHIEWVYVRYARFDLGRVSMVDPRHGTELCRLHPLDKHANAHGHRASLDEVSFEPTPLKSGIAPHLQRLMADYDSVNRPPAYLPAPLSTETAPFITDTEKDNNDKDNDKEDDNERTVEQPIRPDLPPFPLRRPR